jgi:hypothetical protein
MPSDSKTVASPKAKSSARSSLRQSLSLASTVGKAFADAIGKDSREASRNAKKTRDASRRASALISPPAGPRASMGDVRPPSQVSKRTATPDARVVTRRRVSTTHQRSSPDEQLGKPSDSTTPQPTIPTRLSTLRPRISNATSALPKYRPKSAIESAKPPSPVRAGTRRRLSTSEDEKKEQTRPRSVISSAEKISRPISPLPHRAALKTNLTNSSSVNVTPSTPTKSKVATPAIHKSSPSRPTKMVKTGPTSNSRSSSSASSSSLNPHTPSTPKGSDIKGIFNSTTRSGRDIAKFASPNPSPKSSSRGSPSPLARRVRKNPPSVPSSFENIAGNMSHILEGDSEDSEVDDVELLLAPTAALGAPTPAMPRVHKSRTHTSPQTPTRLGLPSRLNLSYLSPLPPDSDGKSSSLRPSRRTPGSDRAARGSILSWEQLASEASKTLAEDDLERMLSDIPAPFRSGAVSPSLSSQMDGPSSPCLSAIDSPPGSSSIAQVILNLPDITPSPAVHYGLQQSRFSLSPDSPSGDSGTVTMLRLQLAAADDKAKNNLSQVLGLEEEMHNLKQTHAHQMEEMQRQIAYLEMQARAADDRTSQATALVEQLHMTQISHKQAIEEAVTRTQENLTSSYNRILKAERCKYEINCSLQLAVWGWNAVHETCEMELNIVRDDRALLALFLIQLDDMTQIL